MTAVKIIDMANQIKVGRVSCSQKQKAKRQVNVKREQGKMEAANDLILVSCFMIIMISPSS